MTTFTERLAQQAKKPSRIYGPRARATKRPTKYFHVGAWDDKRKCPVKPSVWDSLRSVSKSFR